MSIYLMPNQLQRLTLAHSRAIGLEKTTKGIVGALRVQMATKG
jgi:hypothetical protein